MEIVGDFSKDLLEKFLVKTSPIQLMDVREIYLSFNPKNSYMPRYVHIVSSAPIPNWDPAWKPFKCEDSIPNKFNDERYKQSWVQDYYHDNKEQLGDVTSLESQKKIGNATGLHGGSFILHPLGKQRGTKRCNLAMIFLQLAEAMNRGDFDVDAPLVMSFKKFRNIRMSRVKIQLQSPKCIAPVLRNIDLVLKRKNACTYSLKFKTDVATYLNQLKEFENAPKFFENPIKSTTDYIPQIIKRLDNLPYFQAPSKATTDEIDKKKITKGFGNMQICS